MERVSTSASPEVVAHPVDVLMEEHRVIQVVLDAMEAMALSLRRGEELRQNWWQRAVDFIEVFADECHHGKEEDLLFPAMVAHGVQDGGGPIGVMKLEHVHGRELKAAMSAANAKADCETLAANAMAFVELLRQHIDKEDHCLFAMARAHLPQANVTELLAKFEQFESGHMGAGTHCRYLGVARDLCTEAGVQFDRDGERGHAFTCSKHS